MPGNLKPADKVEAVLLGVCLLTLLLYLYNIIAGKLIVTQQATLPHLSEVKEFLTLTVSVASFIFWTMRREATAKRRGE